MKPLLGLLLAGALCAQEPIRGFAPGRVAAEHELERKARALPDPSRARAYMKKMAAEPHHAGSPGSKAVAEYALGLLKQWGYDARIEEFEALLPYPTARSLEMTAPVKFKAKLSEPVIPEDADSGDGNQLPLYNAYSASGDVTAPLVYVNYGIPKDYETLKKMGIDVKGKIAIARYGESWRGTKAKTAQERGALGCIIYSDPKDDGFFQGDAFPKGPWRPADSAQRGSVMDMPVYVGDPLSPGWASERGARKLKIEEAATVMKIPVLPLSWAEAKPLLEQLNGPVAPKEWRGGLSLTYHLGPGPATVRLKTDFDWTSKPIYNVIARMPGKDLPDEWVIYGNHHDAWVNGASDPVSGAVALLETARSLAELRKSGWQPSRTLLFALWDAEEFGLVGSTEWVEKHRQELRQKTVAYINSDNNTGGRFGAGGSAVLDTFLREVARDIVDPRKEKTLLALAEQEKDKKMRLSPLGAGSDYVAFVHHAGIASLNLGFNTDGAMGTYHSIYDSYAWFSNHMDKDFQYSRALAQVMATSMLRLSEASVHPFEFGRLERALGEYTGEIKGVEFGAVTREREQLRKLSERYEAALARNLGRLSSEKTARLNAVLRGLEQALTRESGLPGREWYKHQIYAPGLYTGYSARTLPGVREAADAGRMADANEQAGALADTLGKFAAQALRAVEILEAN